MKNTSLDYFLIAAFDNEIRNKINLNTFPEGFLSRNIGNNVIKDIIKDYLESRIKEMKDNSDR